MTDLRQAAQMALKCIERCNAHGWILADYEDEVESAITALREALEKSEPPPEWEGINNIIAEYGLQAIDFVADWKTAQRPWQGLTDEEVKHLYPYGRSVWGKETYEAIEKALKERNHG